MSVFLFSFFLFTFLVTGPDSRPKRTQTFILKESCGLAAETTARLKEHTLSFAAKAGIDTLVWQQMRASGVTPILKICGGGH